MRSGGVIPAPQKGYLSDTCAIPHENKAKWMRYPPLRYYLEKVLCDMGGISHWAARLGLGLCDFKSGAVCDVRWEKESNKNRRRVNSEVKTVNREVGQEGECKP